MIFLRNRKIMPVILLQRIPVLFNIPGRKILIRQYFLIIIWVLLIVDFETQKTLNSTDTDLVNKIINFMADANNIRLSCHSKFPKIYTQMLLLTQNFSNIKHIVEQKKEKWFDAMYRKNYLWFNVGINDPFRKTIFFYVFRRTKVARILICCETLSTGLLLYRLD